MKKKWIICVLAVYLAVSALCFWKLDSFNPLRAGFGLLRVMTSDDAVVQIAGVPDRVYLVSPDNGYAVFQQWLETEGYALLECEQMGSQCTVERRGIREAVYWSANGFYHKWVWGEELPVPDQDEPEVVTMPAKPVIYLYPEEITDVTVELDYVGELTCTYPAYNDGWQVTAHPDGILVDKTGLEYNYLYWEGSELGGWPMDEGFCVAGSDTAVFLEEALQKLGLTRREANEFIVYWLPLMEDNPYNLICFQGDAYTDAAKLEVTPAPDTVIRVFMTYKPLAAPVEITPQELDAPERNGFTVVEWGGGEVK